MRIGITGVNGHLGNNIARCLVNEGYILKGLARSANSEATKDIKIDLIEGDLFNADSLDELCKDIDLLIHLAAKVSIYPSEKELIYKTNIDGVDNIIGACRRNGIKKIIHFSSIHAHESYGPDISIDESTKYVDNENSAYDYSKSMGEQKMIALRKEGINVSVINPTSVIGPYDFKPSLQGKLFMDIYKGKMPFIVDAGFDWVDNRDIAHAVHRLIKLDIPNENFLISGHWMSIENIAKRIMGHKNKKYRGVKMPLWLPKMGVPFVALMSKITGSPPLYTRESMKALEEGSKNVKNDKARSMLGYTPRPTDKTIDDSITWLIKHNSL